MIQIIAFSSKAAITFITTVQGAPARKLSGERKEKLNIYLLYPIPRLSVLFQMLHVEQETSRKKQSQSKKTKSRPSPPFHLSASERLPSAVTMAALVWD